MAPSLEALRRAFPNVTAENLRTARAVMRGEVDPVTVSRAAADRERRAYNPHAKHVLQLEAVAELLNLDGPEYIPRGRNVRTSPAFYYLNAGDTYRTTILMIRPGQTFRIGCWGDIVERGDYE